MPNLVSVTRPSIQILGKTGVFPISGFLLKPFKKKIVNYRTSDDIDMKLAAVTKVKKIKCDAMLSLF